MENDNINGENILDDLQNRIQGNSWENKRNSIKKTFIALISFAFPIIEIIFQVIMIIKYREYDLNSKQFLAGLGTFFMSLLSIYYIGTSITLGVLYYLTKNIKMIFIQIIVIVMRVLMFTILGYEINENNNLGLIFTIYKIFEVIYYCTCISYSVICLYFFGNII